MPSKIGKSVWKELEKQAKEIEKWDAVFEAVIGEEIQKGLMAESEDGSLHLTKKGRRALGPRLGPERRKRN